MHSKTILSVYLALVHIAILIVVFLFKDTVGLWFFAIELTLLASWLLGLRLIKRATAPSTLLRSFSDLLEESEFATRLSPVGYAETDEIIKVYNRMLDTLQKEYLRIGEQRGFFDEFLNTAPVGILILDFDQNITVANEMLCDLIGQKFVHLQGRSLAQLEDPFMQEVLNIGVGDEKIISYASGRRIRVQASAFLDRGFQRKLYIFEELTELLALSEKQAYEKLIRTMSHEVNNTVAATSSLLQSCLNYTEQLRLEDQSDYHTALNVAIKRNQRLNEFMQAYARVIKLAAPIKHQLDLITVLEQLEVIFRAECEQRSILWVKDYPQDPHCVILDQSLFEQALINICRNALDAINTDGVITIAVDYVPAEINANNKKSTDQASQTTRLRIIDSANLLSSADVGQLFSPFYTTRQTGQGIGLTLVKEILSSHQFVFNLYTNDNQQTVFEILI